MQIVVFGVHGMLVLRIRYVKKKNWEGPPKMTARYVKKKFEHANQPSHPASQTATPPVSRQAGEPASKPASDPDSQEASQPASRKTNRPAS